MRALLFWAVAWVFAYAVWMVHADSGKLPELVAGAIVATVAATATELVRRQRVAGIALRPAFLRRAWRVVAGVVPDVGRLTVAAFSQLLRPRDARGRTIAIPFPHGGDEPQENGRRALAQALGSFAPNTIVIGIDPDRGRLIAHQLEPTPSSSDLDPLSLA
jgi:multisubunit Na+/H+ antiporter MnhE subunit